MNCKIIYNYYELFIILTVNQSNFISNVSCDKQYDLLIINYFDAFQLGLSESDILMRYI